MTRFRLSFVFAAALLATVWGVGDARVPASMRRLRGQPGRVVADAGVPDAVQADASAPDPERRPDSRRPAALPAVARALPVLFTPGREQYHTAAASATPRLVVPHASRAPPRLA